MGLLRTTIEGALKGVHIESGRKDEWVAIVNELETAITAELDEIAKDYAGTCRGNVGDSEEQICRSYNLHCAFSVGRMLYSKESTDVSPEELRLGFAHDYQLLANFEAGFAGKDKYPYQG